MLFEPLEPRALLDGSLHFHHVYADPADSATAVGAGTAKALSGMTPLGSASVPAGALTPNQVRTAYGVASISLGGVVGNGAGQTIAIVDAYDNPRFVSSSDAGYSTSDLHQFNVQFNLTDFGGPGQPTFRKLNQSGGTGNYPAADSGWAGEIALDVQWAHAIAPMANIVLVEANDSSFANLSAAVDTARRLPGVCVVSMSFGSPESGSDSSENWVFTTPAGHSGVTFVASSGDSGAPGVFPAYSPNVIAVGGTTLALSGNDYVSEAAWDLGGGGQSQYQSEPAWQYAVQSSGRRQIPDVAWNANPSTGVAVYDSYNGASSGGPWYAIGGTSLGAPCWAGLIAIANQLRVSEQLSPLDGAAALKTLYSLPVADFHDITSGNNGHSAVVGYDEATGLGTPVADRLVRDLALPGVPAPAVAAVSPSFAGGTLPLDVDTLTVNFSAPVIGGGTAANYQLSTAGADGLLGTADDQAVSVTVSWNGSTATLNLPPLAENVYRLTIRDTLANANGRQLDGNGDAAAGGNWVADFVAVPTGALLGAATAYSTGRASSPLSVAAGDFNGDSRPDLAVANSGNNTVLVLVSDGSGGFTARSSYSSGYSNVFSSAVPYAVTACDLNGDGKLDLATANYDQTKQSGTVQIFLGNGNGAFTAGNTYSWTNGSPIGIAAGDFNGDGKVDLAAPNYNGGTVTVLTGDGDGTFSNYANYSSGGANARAVAVADFNGDGKPDLAVANYDASTVGLLVNSGNGTFTAVTTYGTGGANPRSLAAADLNADGKPDLVVGNYASGNVGVLLNRGAGTFPATAAVYHAGGANLRGIAIADFNGDGKPDLAATNNGSDNLGILLGDGSGRYSSATTVSTGSGSGPFGLVAADFNADGKPDLAVTESSIDAVGIHLNIHGPNPVALSTPHGLMLNAATGAFGPGEFISGSNHAFNGYGRLRVGGAMFQPSALGYSIADSGQSVLIAGGIAAGLNISRKVTVPNTGIHDFARTVDAFTNPTASPITTTVQIVGNLGSDAGTTVFATSDGNNLVDPGDQWIGTDDADGSGAPAILHYLHGPFGLRPSSVSVLGDNIQWTYNLTVPAGRTVRLAYLTILGTTRAAAVASANALVADGGLGVQAAAFLSETEFLSLANFVLLHTQTWIGPTDGNWTDRAWSNSPPESPSSLVDAVVDTPHVITVNSAEQAHSLAVSGGGQVTIAARGSLSGNQVSLGPSGTLNVLAGGTLTLSGLAKGGDPASLHLSGGVLTASADFASVMPLTIDTGGATVDTNGLSVTLSGALGRGTGSGGLSKIGDGALTLSGANNYRGGTTVSSGTLVASSDSALPAGGSLTIGAGGTVVLSSGLSVSGASVAAASALAGSAAATPDSAANPANAEDAAITSVSATGPAVQVSATEIRELSGPSLAADAAATSQCAANPVRLSPTRARAHDVAVQSAGLPFHSDLSWLWTLEESRGRTQLPRKNANAACIVDWALASAKRI